MSLTKVTYSMIQGAAFNVLDYGAKGDGATDDQPAIQAALDAANSAGGGTVYVPTGTYLIGTQAVQVPSNVRFIGAGIGATILQQDLATNAFHLVECGSSTETTENIEVGYMTLIGIGSETSWATGGHGIRVGGMGIVNSYFHDCEISNITSYGIGVQGGYTGTIQNLKIERCYIHDTGSDGIDFKNRTWDGKNNVVNECLIERHDRRGVGNNTGIDCRGPLTISNCIVRDYGEKTLGSGTCGIRTRQGEDNVTGTGTGGHYTRIVNCYIEPVQPNNAAKGIELNGRYSEVCNVTVVGATRAFSALQRGNQFSNCSAIDAIEAGVSLLKATLSPDLTTYPEQTNVTNFSHRCRQKATGTAQAGASTSITLASSDTATVTDAYYNYKVYISSGTGSGQVRVITAYNPTTKVATVDSAWGVNPDSTSVYLISPVSSAIYSESDNNTFTGVNAQSTGIPGYYGVLCDALSSGNTLTSSSILGYASAVYGASSELVVDDVNGCATENFGYVDVPVDATGAGEVSWTHGLDFTPDSAEATIYKDTGSAFDWDNWQGRIQIRAITSTLVVIRYNIFTAEGTAGAKVRVGIWAKAKNIRT